MIKILDRQLHPVGILENAFKIGYEKTFNALLLAAFTLPLNDPKNVHCQPLHYVEVWDYEEYVGLFRIIPSITVKNESTKEITYTLEHVLATLLDDVLFLYHQTDNLTTEDNIQFLLDKQTVKHWKSGKVDFVRYFSYKYENENGLLGPMFSVPKPFDQPYQWTYDTQSYPWTLNLVEPEKEVSCVARYGHNQRGIEREVDPAVIFNRIYALGYGEGDNQLTIKSVNGGLPYVEDAESIAKYGVRPYIWVDRRFENPESLKASAEALLKKWKDPKVIYRGSAADVSRITGMDMDKLKMGRIIRWIDDDIGTFDARIVKESKGDITGNPGDVQLEMANKTEDLGTTQADIERRQQINELYSQGATNLLAYSYNDNADQNNPADIMIYLPEEMVKVNKLLLTYKTDNFRAYEQAIEGGGATVKSTTAGGGTVKSTKSGGGSTQSSSSGGGVSRSTAAGGGAVTTSSEKVFASMSLTSGVPINSVGNENWGHHLHEVVVPGDPFKHNHTITIPDHSHSFTVPDHSHTVQIPSHTHEIDLPDHTHSIELPDHTHGIKFGIYKHDKLPGKVTITVDGNAVPVTGLEGQDIDLLQHLSKDADGKVSRGWHTVSIKPDNLGRINANIISQFFIQSRGGESF
ncbi:hypothetical protein D1B31_16320 [Neobacillus notoginsengisoli]|uniref:Tail spike domain-containing protein n=1 Tax=Neobacillus notoginsengisoli TaxID=1578198 RepID=A0A417YRP5_9BACI|nr:phage tail spike protein [Neobacillus notoginsengisoli]RHW37328.1 hypothetical protein D1B31_16320 [Neobacillus notoginsengisoli]